MRTSIRIGVAALAATAATASAADPPATPRSDAADVDTPKVEGDVRFGWRFLSGEGQGRFPQDYGLKDGGRVFDMNVLASGLPGSAIAEEFEAKVSGVGDPYSDYLLSARRRGVFDLSGGYRRDDFDYRATGDPFPYDTVRERSFLHGRWTPNQELTVRFSWDRSDRRGEAFTTGYDYITITQDPRVQQRRTISQESDRFSLGADYAVGIFRFGLGQSVGVAHVDDSRFSDSPDPAVATHDTTRLYSDSRSYVSTGKAGVSLLDGKLDATLFVTRTHVPLDEHASGDASGSSPPTYPLSGDGRLRRDATDWRFETSWRPRKDWEVTFAGESDDVDDEESGIYYLNSNVKPESSPRAHITDRCQRWSVDATWDATDELRLRLGEQYLREEVFVPTDSHFRILNEPSNHAPTDFASNSLRTTAGVDWKSGKTWSVGALTRISTNDAPQTTSVADRSSDWSLRVKWNPSAQWSMTSLWRRTTTLHTGAVPVVDLSDPDTTHAGRTADLDSSGRATSISESAAWTSAPWTVRATATYRRFDTNADTAFGWREIRVVDYETVGFQSRTVVANLDVRYDVTKTLRVFADAARTSATGDYAARWIDASAGAEYDVRKDVTVGLKFSTWRLADLEVPNDGYRAYGAELSFTYRF